MHNEYELCVRECSTENENELVSRAFDVRRGVNHQKKRTTNEYYELLFIEGLTERTRIHTQETEPIPCSDILQYVVEHGRWSIQRYTWSILIAVLARRVQQCRRKSHALHSLQNLWCSCWIQFAAEITHIRYFPLHFQLFNKISDCCVSTRVCVAMTCDQICGACRWILDGANAVGCCLLSAFYKTQKSIL